LDQKGVTLWFTGLSGSGKTTIAIEVEKILRGKGIRVERLDGDLVREYLSRDLGYSRPDRDENIRRNSFVAKLLTKNGIKTLCSFVSPYRQNRQDARELIKDFIEIYVNAPLVVCEKRDVKVLYKKARIGDISDFTGISDPYKPPIYPEIELRTDTESVPESVDKVIAYLEEHGYINQGNVDLHLHTTASDGKLDPEEFIISAKKAGYTAIAITDHDTTAGLNRAINAGNKIDLEIIPGIELSSIEENREIHILGYFIDPDNEELQNVLAKIIEARHNRACHMIDKLKKFGISISAEEVQAISGGEFIGRPHITKALLEKGYIKMKPKPFSNEFIGRGGKAYVERFKIGVKESIKLIKAAKGIPVLAHPGFLSDGTLLIEDVIGQFLPWGLKGIEVYYSRHTLEQIEYYKKIALKYDLLITGGSDWHGGRNDLLGCVKLPYYYLALQRNIASHLT
jgi:adenylyl-sulfate kinase